MFRIFNHNPLYGVAQMVARYPPTSSKKATTLSSEIQLQNKVEITSAPSLIPMAPLNVWPSFWSIAEVSLPLGHGPGVSTPSHHLDPQQPNVPGYGASVFSPAGPLSIGEGVSQLIQPQSGYYRADWTRADGQPLPEGVFQNGNALQIEGARPEHSGTYNCVLYGDNGEITNVPYVIRVEGGSARPPPSGKSHGTITAHRALPCFSILP
jgi:hypothetical protein